MLLVKIHLVSWGTALLLLIGSAFSSNHTTTTTTQETTYVSSTSTTSTTQAPQVEVRTSRRWNPSTFEGLRPAPDWYWDRVAQCETGGNWQDMGRWAGGLGIYILTWRGYGGDEFAKHPSQATREEQIIVANRISMFGYQTTDQYRTFDDRINNRPFFRPPAGFNGWGCISNRNNNWLKPPVLPPWRQL